MIIVKILGGLGNQMFQYAFYKYLKSKYENVKLDLSFFDNYKLHNGFELKKIFNVETKDVATPYEIKRYSDLSTDFISRFRRKFFGVKSSYILERDFNENSLNKLQYVYLDGYWQSESYFTDVIDDIKKSYNYNFSLNEYNEDIVNKIRETNSISVHVRRGDYISNPEVYQLYGKVCDKKYFDDALLNIVKDITKPHFYVFSDDIDWVRENISFPSDVDYINWNTGQNSYIDMYLISQCKHNIISNSSFSWWGAYLNDNDNKIVIAPKKWKVVKDITPKRIPDSWRTV